MKKLKIKNKRKERRKKERQKAYQVSPAVTRLTVYRRLQLKEKSELSLGRAQTK